jgi:hypothetical protein
MYAVIADVCAFANTNGGSIYIGFSDDPKSPIVGVNNPTQAIAQLEKEISNRISPPLHCTVDAHKTGGKNVLRVLVPRGEDPPYAVDDNKVYVRDEAETVLAVRDEIVNLVKRAQQAKSLLEGLEPVSLVTKTEEIPQVEETRIQPPRTGVEVTSVVERKGVAYYTVTDLRNGNRVKNVTVKSARRLWHYAITNYARLPKDKSKAEIKWQGNLGILRQYKQGAGQSYDLVYKDDENKYHFYFGVTEDGIHGPWQKLVGLEE